jgi:hypothetical protein
MPRNIGAGFRDMHAARSASPLVLPTQALAEQLAAEDAEAVEREAAEREALTPFLEWALRIPEPKTGTLDFSRWPFQRQMYELGVGAHEAVVQKGTQLGISTYLIRWAMYWPDMRGLTSLYVFPKKVQLRDFSQGRVRPLIKRDGGYLATRVPQDNIDNSMMKQIGLGLVYFRGSEVKDDLDSVDADVIAFDEYDRLDQHNIEDAEHRVDASPLGLIRRIGNPTVDDFGISAAYAKSDQRKWRVKCGACGDWQALDFFDNVDTDLVAVVCKKCRKRLDVRKGEWVADYPDRAVVGWWISRLMLHGVNLAKIITNSEKSDPYAQQTFWNKDLGLPWSASEARLSEAHIKACQSRGGGYRMPFEYHGANLVTMGVDVASKRALDVRVSEWTRDDGPTTGKPEKRALWIGKVTRWSSNDPGDGPSLDELMLRYQPHMVGIDHEPEYNSALGMVNRWPGRVVVINYSGTQGDLITVDLDMRRAGVRRTEQIDKAMDMVRSQRNLLPADLPTDYVKMMRSLVRVVEENDKGQRVARYVKTAAADDAMHADVYDSIARDFYWIEQATIEAAAETEQPLDDMLQFQRSDVTDMDSYAYREGPAANVDQYDVLPETDPMAGWDED